MIIQISNKAAKSLKKIERRFQLQIAQSIEKLKEEPFPVGSKKIQGSLDYFRIRSGHFRILYKVDEGKIVILILDIGHRKEIYKKL